MKEELWKDIDGFENLYQISNYGNVKSLQRTIPHKSYGTWTLKEKILKKQLNKSTGYLQVVLSDINKKTYIKTIHRLVAKAFVENSDPSIYTQVDHLDCNKHNNYFENLEWVTSIENTRRALKNGLINRSSQTKDYCKKKVICIELNRIFNSVKEASEFVGIAPTNMSQSCKKGWCTKGYHFKYFGGDIYE